MTRKTIYESKVVKLVMEGQEAITGYPKRLRAKFLTHLRESELDKQFVVGLQSYWRDNVYNHFNNRISRGLPVSGQLGNALVIEKARTGDDFSIASKVKALSHSAELGLPGIQRSSRNSSGGETRNYLPYLMHGTAGSKGAYLDYNRKGHYDRKTRAGATKGVSTSYWNSWMNQFEPHFQEEVSRYIKGKFHQWMRSGVK